MPAYQLHTKSEIHYTGVVLLCQGVIWCFPKKISPHITIRSVANNPSRNISCEQRPYSFYSQKVCRNETDLKFTYLDFILTYDKMNIECPEAMFFAQTTLYIS